MSASFPPRWTTDAAADDRYEDDLAESVRTERRLPWKELLAMAAVAVVLSLRVAGIL